MIRQHINDAYYDHIINWAERVAEPLTQNNGWPLCPYARRAITAKSIKVWGIDDQWDLETLVDTFEFKPWAVEVAICPRADFVDEWTAMINQRQTRITALADDPGHHGIIAGENPSNGLYPLIILQDRSDLISKRQSLKETNYYSTWAQWYKDYVVSEMS